MQTCVASTSDRLNAGSRLPQLSCKSLLYPRGENQLFAFMTLIEHLRLAMYLGKKLSIVQREPNFAHGTPCPSLRKQCALQRLETIVGKR